MRSGTASGWSSSAAGRLPRLCGTLDRSTQTTSSRLAATSTPPASFFITSAGAFPVEGRSLDEIRDAHEAGKRVSLRDRRQDVSSNLADVIERAISPDSAARFDDASAFERALARAEPS